MRNMKESINATVSGRYGKTMVRVFRVKKFKENNKFVDVCEVQVQVLLEGDLELSYSKGDNSCIVPTDTIKNTCYVIAKTSNFTNIEQYSIQLGRHFLNRHSHIHRVTCNMEEKLWKRAFANGRAQEHVFLGDSEEKRICQCVAERKERNSNFEKNDKERQNFFNNAHNSNEFFFCIQSGIKNLKIIKTTDSGFEDYIIDEFTTLKPTKDRILCTNAEMVWSYGINHSTDFDQAYNKIRQLIIDTFSDSYSSSVQQTMYQILCNTLKAELSVEKAKLVMPNIHYFLYNINQFGIQNDKEIFYPTCEPSGLIECCLTRTQLSRL